MNQHKKIEQLLSTYSELSQSDRRLVDQHLDTCQACTATKTAYRSMDRSLLAYTESLIHNTIPGTLPVEFQMEDALSSSLLTNKSASYRRIFHSPHLDNFRDRLFHPPAAALRIASVVLLLLLLLLVGSSGLFFPDNSQIVTAATPTVEAMPTVVPTAIAVDPDDGRVTVRFGFFHAEMAHYHKLISDFEEQNSNIQIDLVPLAHKADIEAPSPEYDARTLDRDAVLAAFLNEQESIDAAAFTLTPGTIDTAHLRDLSPWLNNDPDFTSKVALSSIIESTQWSSGTWAVPLSASTSLIFYNKVAFDEAGLPYPSLDWTWDDFRKAARILTVRNGDTTEQWGYAERWQDYGTLVVSQIDAIDAAATDTHRADIHRIIDEYVGLYHDSKSSPYFGPQTEAGQALGTEPAIDELIDQGKVAMWRDFSGNWQRWSPSITNYDIAPIGAAPFPSSKFTAYTTPLFVGTSLVMSAYTDFPEETWRWLNYVSHHFEEISPLRESVIRTWEDEINPSVRREALREAQAYAAEHSFLPSMHPLYHTIADVLAGLRTVDNAVDDMVAFFENEDELTTAPAPPAPVNRIDYGISASMLTSEHAEKVLAAVNDLGFNWIRKEIRWKEFEPMSGNIDLETLDSIISSANEADVNLLFTINAAPDWAREVGFDPTEDGPPADPQTLAAFASRLAKEFCGSSLKAIELWSEQNLHYAWGNKKPSADEYLALLATTSAAVKGACPIMSVISGGLTPAGHNPPRAVDNLAYFEQMVENGLLDYVDGVGIILPGYNVPPDVHWEEACRVVTADNASFRGACDSPHHSWSFLSTLEAYQERLASVSSQTTIPIWVSEFGWATGDKVDDRYTYVDDNSLEEQAQWTVEAFQILAEHNTGPAFLWNLDGQVTGANIYLSQWGIVDEVWNPLPVYTALHTVVPKIIEAVCLDNRAVLTRPGQAQVVNGIVEIKGSATHQEFQYYKLEYSSGFNADSGWVYFGGGNSRVAQGPLGLLDTSSLANGDYSIRLMVIEQTGNFPPPCQVNVTVQN